MAGSIRCTASRGWQPWRYLPTAILFLSILTPRSSLPLPKSALSQSGTPARHRHVWCWSVPGQVFVHVDVCLYLYNYIHNYIHNYIYIYDIIYICIYCVYSVCVCVHTHTLCTHTHTHTIWAVRGYARGLHFGSTRYGNSDAAIHLLCHGSQSSVIWDLRMRQILTTLNVSDAAVSSSSSPVRKLLSGARVPDRMAQILKSRHRAFLSVVKCTMYWDSEAFQNWCRRRFCREGIAL